MKANSHQLLWERICNFSIDDPSAPFKFSDKLARKNGWTPAFTSRAIDEYKRFILLCCISPSGASPSEAVDEVWHLHLTYTENYWKRFCTETLEKEIHHHPSKGGSPEKEKHRRWYADTLRLYREVFDEDPPADIWPSASLQPAFESPLPPNYWQPYRKNFYFLLLPFLYPLLFGKFHPYALNGPQFLLFYALLLGATVVVFFRVRNEKKRLIEEQLAAAGIAGANTFQLARYIYGRAKAIEAAVVDLVSKGILVTERDGKMVFHPSKYKGEEREKNPIVSGLVAAYREGNLLTLKDVAAHYESDRTRHEGLQHLYQTVNQKDYGRFLTPGFVILIGLLRAGQGMANDKPVQYLVMMMIAGGILLLILAALLSAKELLKRIFNRRYNEQQLVLPQEQNLLGQFVFLGLATLAGSYAFANLETTFRQHDRSTAGADASSGCGSSDGGSSCGGGGCGGCGGGD